MNAGFRKWLYWLIPNTESVEELELCHSLILAVAI